MEEIPGEEDHVDVSFPSQAHDFVKTSPAVLPTPGISFVVPDMIVGSDQDTDGVCIYPGISIQVETAKASATMAGYPRLMAY